MGDFNLNLLEFDIHAHVNGFLNLLASFSLMPLITKPTRVTEHSSTVIDNIFCNIQPLPHAGIVISDLSDHFPVYAKWYDNKSKCTSSGRYIRKFNPQNVARLKEALLATDWCGVLLDDDADSSYDKFMNTFMQLYNDIIPLCKCKSGTNNKSPRMPWITRALLKSINKKNKLYYKYKTSKSIESHRRYSTYRNILTTLLRVAKKDYYHTQFQATFNDTKGTWRVIRQVLNSSQNKSSIKTLCVDGAVCDDKQVIVNNLNEYCCTIGPTLSRDIPRSNKMFCDFLPESNQESLFLLPTNEEELFTIINSLKNKKSPGYDQISNELVTNVFPGIVKPLVHIFNLSIMTGIVPIKIKIAKVVPIFKKGDPQLLNNYRPISLLTSFSKILEKIVFTRTIKFLNRNKIISNTQFGFREKHSTTHAILHFIEKISSALDNRKHTIGVLLDYSKAFDTVNHDILLSKLSHYGVRGIALEWYRSYLTNRTQYVSLDGFDSELLNVTHGVPQGSLLGPLLFVVYINDFHFN